MTGPAAPAPLPSQGIRLSTPIVESLRRIERELVEPTAPDH